MSPQVSSSEPKRRRSPIVRDPSPKRNRRDGKAESEVPPANLEMLMLRSAQASQRKGKAPLAPKHTNSGGVGPYRRSCTVAGGERRSDQNERKKHTRSKNHLIEKKIPAVDVQKANKAITKGYPHWMRMRMPWICRGHTHRRMEDDSSGDDVSDVSDGDGDGDDIRTKAK